MSQRRLSARSEGNPAYQEKFETLVRTSAAIFKQKGYEQTSLDDVAAALQIDRASLYYYVASKKELFFEVVHAAVTDIAAAADGIRTIDAPADVKLRKMMVAVMDNYHKHYPNVQVYLQVALSELETSGNADARRLKKMQDKFEDAIKSIVQEGIDQKLFSADLGPTLVAFACLGMANWSYRWLSPHGSMTGSEIGDMFARILLDGIRVPDAPAQAKKPATRPKRASSPSRKKA